MDSLLSQISAKYAAAEARIAELEDQLEGRSNRRISELELKVSVLEFNLERKSQLLDTECHLTHELKTKLAALEASPRIRGHDEAEIVVAVTKIARGVPDATERQVLEAWRKHAAEVAEDDAARQKANESGAELRSWLGSWLTAGAPQEKRLCGCLEWDCPSLAMVYRPDRGFVDERALSEDERQAGGVKESMRHCIFTGRELSHKSSSAPEEALETGAAGGDAPAPAPAPQPAAPKTWAQIASGAAAPKRR